MIWVYYYYYYYLFVHQWCQGKPTKDQHFDLRNGRHILNGCIAPDELLDLG